MYGKGTKSEQHFQVGNDKDSLFSSVHAKKSDVTRATSANLKEEVK